MRINLSKMSRAQHMVLGAQVFQRCAELAEADVKAFFAQDRDEEFTEALHTWDFAPKWEIICDELNLPRWSTGDIYQSLYHEAKHVYRDTLPTMCHGYVSPLESMTAEEIETLELRMEAGGYRFPPVYGKKD